MLAPDMWNVPDRVWKHYVMMPNRHERLCLKCWQTLVKKTDGGAYQKKYGKPIMLTRHAVFSRLLHMVQPVQYRLGHDRSARAQGMPMRPRGAGTPLGGSGTPGPNAIWGRPRL